MNFGQIPSIRALVRRHFFAGLLVVLPLGVILWMSFTGLELLWGLKDLLPEAWRPDGVDPSAAVLVNLAFTLGMAILIVLGISLTGWISKQFLGRKALQFIAEIIQHIPVLRSVYNALDQLLRAVAAGGGQQFSRVVYIEYPRQGCWALAFVTSNAQGPAIPPKHLNVYIPTTPNPTSGFHLIVPEQDVRESQLSVEEAFRTILSLGIAQSPAAPGPRKS